eukprot:m51a1_g6694 hypothetical protein (195) ;mRNA; r:79605-80261
MHSNLSRLNAIGAFTGSVLLTVTALNAAHGLFLAYTTPSPTATITVDSNVPVSLQTGTFARTHVERPVFSFDLDADLSSLFNWNTKQVHLYVTADYTHAGLRNEVVLLDRMVFTKDASRIHLHYDGTAEPQSYCPRSAKTGWSGDCLYLLFDNAGTLAGNTVRIVPRWRVIPVSGMLLSGNGTASDIAVPSNSH